MTHWSFIMLVTDNERANDVVKILSDEYSRRIVFALSSKAMTVEEISKEQNIPMSTCYRRIHSLLSHGMIRVDRTIISDDGKKFICYVSAFENASISVEGGELKVDVVVSDSSPRFNMPYATTMVQKREHPKSELRVPLISA